MFPSTIRIDSRTKQLHYISPRAKTITPVPNVPDAYEYEGSFYLWTELVPGIQMEKLSPSDQATVMVEIEEHLCTFKKSAV